MAFLGSQLAGRNEDAGILSPVHPQGPATSSRIDTHHEKSLLVKAQGARVVDVV